MARKIDKAGGKKRQKRRPISNVWKGRILFIASLCAVAVGLAFATSRLLTQSEYDLAVGQFESVADRALDAARDIARRKRLGTVSMSTIVAYQLPDADVWPFVLVQGFEAIATKLIQTASGRDMVLLPIVALPQLERFETFAYDYYGRVFPPNTAVSSFGKGVFGVDPTLNTTDQRYRERDGISSDANPNRILTPLVQHNLGPFSSLMLNVRSVEVARDAIDSVIECTKKRNMAEDSRECSAITDVILFRNTRNPRPGALIMQPIFPFNNQTVLTGFISSSIVWDEIMRNIFSESVSGVDCVLQTGSKVYTYTVINGDAYLRGEGDWHDHAYAEYERRVSLTDADLFATSSPPYTLILYPNNALFDVYSTNNPYMAAIGAAAIILGMSLLFFLYDFFVRREFHEKQSVLDAKRTFVRFVSHEVRTPLNTVCMGLRLLKEELVGVLLGCPQTLDQGQPVDSRSPAELKDSLFALSDEVLTNAESAVDVLNDLLNYDKIEMGTLILELTTFPIWKLIEQISAEFELPAKSKSICLKQDWTSLFKRKTNDIECSGGISSLSTDFAECRFVGDAVRITQVFRNLLSNAIKFSHRGGSIMIRTSWVKPKDQQCVAKESLDCFTLSTGEEVCYPQNGHVQVEVIDTGVGMTREQLEKLFRHGVQFNANNLQSGQGSGLGLYIAKGIAEQHGGTLIATSAGLNRGTTFTLVLPLHKIPSDCLSTSSTKSTLDQDFAQIPHLIQQQQPTGNLRLLIVDDVAMNRKILRRLLEQKGHDCFEAENGQTAVELVQKSLNAKQGFDSILLDFEMPIMDGPSACRKMRDIGCQCCIVGITGNILPHDVALFKRAGADMVLPKPLHIEALEDVWLEYGLTGCLTFSKDATIDHDLVNEIRHSI